MLEVMNCIFCTVLLFLTFPVAASMKATGCWVQRVTFCCVVLVLGAQVTAPLFDFLPSPNWLQTVSNALILGTILSAPQQIMALVRLMVGVDSVEEKHPLRRVDDISDSQLGRVHGRGKV